MAAISSSDFSAGQYLTVSLSGIVNLRASHTMAVRLKNSSTSTTIDSVVMGYAETGFTWSASGSGVGRNNGVTSTAMNVYRINDSFSPTADAGSYSTCYGNTTTWYHLCFVYNTTNIRFYIDGTFIGQHASATTRTASDTTNLFTTAQHPGKFADACMYSVALNDEQVKVLATYRVPQITSNLMFFWRLDSNANDSSGNGRNGAATGSGSAITYSTSDNPSQTEGPTGTGSASTSGTASVAKTYNLGACTGSASTSGTVTVASAAALAPTSSTTTSGTAAVSMSNVVASGPGKNFAWADVTPQIRQYQGYRFPSTTALFAGSSGSAAPAGADMTLMAWVRWRAVIPTGVNSAASTTAFLQMVGSTNLWAMDILVFDAGAAVGLASATYISGVAQTVRQSNVDFDWHHICVTYSAGVLKTYVDGSQVGADQSVTFPTTETGLTFNIADNSPGNAFVDAAHMKAWVGRALNSTEIANEIASFAPVTDVSGTLRAYYPLAWDNPGWDVVAGRDLTGITHGDDNAAFGPPGAWPEKTAAGSCTTSGSADVQNVLSLGSVTGSANTSGSATVNLSLEIGACTGATSTSGTADLVSVILATASTTTSGTADVAVSHDFGSSASTQTSGSASAASSAELASNASTQTSGSTSITSSASLTASASASTAGFASVNPTYDFASSGATQTAGTATVGIEYPVTASGSAQTSGAVAVTASAGIASSASTQTSGTAAAAAAAGIAATGATSTAGTATVSSASDIAAAASNQTSGTAAMSSAASISATGEAATSGVALTEGTLVSTGATSTQGTTSFDTASFPVVPSGSTSTAGTAALSADAALATSGSTSTSGQAALAALADISAVGSATTDGNATLASGNDVSGSGSGTTVGTVALVALYDISAAGSTSSAGASAPTASAGIAAAGESSTSASAIFVMYGAANNQTDGSVTNFTASADIASAGQASTSGVADVGNGIFPSGETQTLGTAAVTVSVSISASGSNITYGDAAFAGVVPPSGGFGNRSQEFLRRGAAIEAGRRRIR